MPKFRELGGSNGSVTKWSTPGQVVEGVVRQLKKGKTFAGNSQPSMLAVVGDVTVGLPTALRGKFEENGIIAGHYIRITYLGEEKSKGGVTFKNFKLEVDEESGPTLAPALPPATPAAAPAASPTAALEARLAAKVGATGAGTIIGALKQVFKEEAAYLTGLENAVKAQGA